MATLTALDDRALVEAARGGDRDAVAAIYDRYADRIHDFCRSVLRDADEAADATQDTFLLAWKRLGQLRDPAKLRPWLYAIARNEALRRCRARGRTTPSDTLPDLPVEDEPGGGAARRDLVALVWDAASGLEDRDRALLDLSVRQGLDGQEVADALGIRRDHAYVLVSNLRKRVERSLGALLVARQGSADCDDLQVVLRGWDGRFTPLVRKRVARHVDRCTNCGEARDRMVSPAALLAAVPLVAAPAALRQSVLAAPAAAAAGAGSGAGAGGAATAVSTKAVAGVIVAALAATGLTMHVASRSGSSSAPVVSTLAPGGGQAPAASGRADADRRDSTDSTVPVESITPVPDVAVFCDAFADYEALGPMPGDGASDAEIGTWFERATVAFERAARSAPADVATLTLALHNYLQAIGALVQEGGYDFAAPSDVPVGKARMAGLLAEWEASASDICAAA